MQNSPASDIDEYISRFPKNIQKRLADVRATIRRAAPEARETIKYGIPTFTLNGILISFAAFKNHLGVYPAPKGSSSFEKQLAVYKRGKSTVQFPFDQPIPLSLLTKIVQLRVKKDQERKPPKSR